MNRLFLLILLFPLYTTAQNSFGHIDQLMAEQQEKEAMMLLQEMETSFMPTEKFTAWEIAFQGEVWKVVHGKNHLYYQLHLSNATKDAPGRAQAMPTISVNHEQSDWQFAVVCVELSSGQILWSRNVNGLVNLSVNPESDILHLYRELEITLDPTSGEILRQKSYAGKKKERETEIQNAPVWKNGQAFYLTGSKFEPEAVVHRNPDTEENRWSFLYPWGKYDPNHHQLRGGSYPEEWLPLTAIQSFLLALDERGHLYFLNPFTGISAASVRLAKDYLEMPFQIENQLIVASYHGVTSYSIPHLFSPETSLYSELKMRQATCLFNLEQYKETLQLLDTIINQAPHHSKAWQKRAQVCMALGENEEAFWSDSRYISLSGKSEDYNLYNRWGVMKQYNLGGRPAWSLVPDKDFIYAGSMEGKLWAIQQSNLKLQLVAPLNRKIIGFNKTTGLSIWPEKPSYHRGETFPKAVPKVNPLVNPGWYLSGGEERISQPYAYRGGQYRTTLNGGVRILQDTHLIVLPPLMNDIGAWKIHFSSTGPMGYGKGVYELDEVLRAVRWLIRPQVNGAVPSYIEIAYMQTTANTIGLVVNSSAGAVLQVYSREGKLLNEAPLGRFISSRSGPNPFIPVGNGYLFSDRQLTWVSAELDGKIWKLGPSLNRTSGDRFGDRWRYYGDPLLENGLIYVTDAEGHILVIDTRRIIE